MYHAIVRHRLRSAFADLNAGRYERIPAQFAAQHRHSMVGTHALGGERRDLAATARWYGRLQRLLPGLRFDVDGVWVSGWPWRTRAVVAWRDRFQLPGGREGSNRGMHEFELRWGRVSALTVHCDTARLAGYLAEVAAAGQPEALAEPITG
ncbi:nuclear transport factor 2 family protein [Roseateles sp. DXS20W]|uniref:Nuclear transport factor 2 family protein n=1 Tax=Pelomonas lactea TaxID=3299030 RepID=A0ABW7GNI6_9BURK